MIEHLESSVLIKQRLHKGDLHKGSDADNQRQRNGPEIEAKLLILHQVLVD